MAKDKDAFAVELGTRIKKRREELRINQRDLAAATDVKGASIAMYESGARVPSLEVFVSLTKVLGTTADNLLGATDQQDVFIDDDVAAAFRQYASLSPRDRRVIMEVMRAMASVKE
ncbi:hypothetical protein A2G06_01110 [Geobacter anodireducens]|nr:hypothetical protein A2G06_01110 [Geobacter anodireducens]